MKTDEILNLNNQISQLKKELEAHQLENLDYESKKDHSLQVCTCPYTLPFCLHTPFPHIFPQMSLTAACLLCAQVASTRTLEYGQVCMATTNLFNRCRELSKIAHANVSNPVDQLEVVGNYVADLGAIIKVHKSQGGKA
jgi:hypothetical protein